MASFPITTNAIEDAVIAFALPQINAERALNGKPPFTAADLIDYFVREQLKAYYAAQLDAENTQVCDAFEAATPAKRNQVKTVLGL